MNDDSIRHAVLSAYRQRYPDWTDVELTAITHNVSGGMLAVVQATDEDKDDVEEICFVSTTGKVRIFDATAELVTYLENIGSFRHWIFTGQGVSAIAFFILLAAVIICAFRPLSDQNATAFDVLKQVLLLAAGFFFANQGAHRERQAG
jgi:hypothetical protein